MILRRLSNALRKQDWFTVAVETLIVIFGVFIGLQVNNWNEAFKSSAREAVLKDQLIVEVSLMIDENSAYITQIEQSLSNVEWLMEAFSQPDVSLSEDGFLKHANVMNLPAPVERSPAYLEAQSSGGLSLIEDASLRTALVKWDRLLENVATTQQAQREFSRAYVASIVRLGSLYGNVPFDEALEQSGSRYDFIIALSTLGSAHDASLQMFRDIESESEALLAALKGESGLSSGN